ncbi:Hexitol phosphatase HxpB [Gammaproteobacteria bacterium]
MISSSELCVQSAINSVIFDFDGVIIDSEPCWHKAKFNVFNEHGILVSDNDILRTVGKRIEEIVKEYQQTYNFGDAAAKKMTGEIYSQANEGISENAQVISGLYGAIDLLLSHNKTLAIASSSPVNIIISILKKLQLNDAFSVVYSAESEAYGKPHPAVYLTAADKLNCNVSNCFVIEDSLNGLISAKAARMKCVLIDDCGDKYFNCIADKVIRDLSGINVGLIHELEKHASR